LPSEDWVTGLGSARRLASRCRAGRETESSRPGGPSQPQ
jgi:hypothetical protein